MSEITCGCISCVHNRFHPDEEPMLCTVLHGPTPAMVHEAVEAEAADCRGEYGKAGRRYHAHRVSAMLHHGVSLAEDVEIIVRHKCDNRRCTNPDHLELGSQQDNIDDAMARGRFQVKTCGACGERGHHSRMLVCPRRKAA